MIVRNWFFGFAASAGLILATQSGAQASTVYNAVNDFSSTNGGSNPWSYAYRPTTMSAPVLLDQFIPSVFAGIDGWHNSNGSCCGGSTSNNSVLIAKNTTSGTVSYETIVQPNDYLESDPEGNASADLIFTAPTAGTYTATFGFLGIDVDGSVGPHPVDVLVNGVSVFCGTITGYGVSKGGSFSLLLAAGSTVDFQTLTSPATYAYLSTGVQANIVLSTVPLPASAPMFGAALLALGGLGYGMKRRGSATA